MKLKYLQVDKVWIAKLLCTFMNKIQRNNLFVVVVFGYLLDEKTFKEDRVTSMLAFFIAALFHLGPFIPFFS